ncbi:MAG: xylulokinase [Aestuariivirga sp.]|nr:xylulokinase [Aestuariivirga sp.]
MAFSTSTYLGIDLGTTALKCIITDHKQCVVGLAEVALAISRPRPGWSEQNPQDWWLALQRACKMLRARNRKEWGRIAAIGLSGQMHGAVVLDAAGRVLRPAILWNDSRAGAEAAMFNGKFSDIGQIAGVPAVAGFTAPKLIWLQAHEPRIYKQLAMVLAPKDYLRFRMSGDFITDPCDASGMSLLDVAERKWSPALVEAAGIRLENLPRIDEGPIASAHLRKPAADFLGLPPGLPIAAGAGDAAASAIGIGAITDGDGFISLGTSAQYFVTTKSFRPRPQQMIQALGHGLPGLWYQVAALLNGASPLSWLNGILPGGNIQKLLQRSQRRYEGAGGILFLPYLNGERTPHNDPSARAAFHGLHAGATQEDLAIAVLEGVALSLADCQEVLERSGTRVAELLVAGGGTRSAFWMQMLANVLNRRITIPAGSDVGAAFGAARLARLSVTAETIAEVCRKPEVLLHLEPTQKLSKAYADRLGDFRALYGALKGIQHV